MRYEHADLFDPSGLATPDRLLRRHLALVLVDEGLGGSASFYWLDDAPNGPLAHWEGGVGDHYFLRRAEDGALLWGFDHESPMSPWAHPDEPEEWPGMTRGLPGHLRAVLDAEPDPNYSRAVTFCFWHQDDGWHTTQPELPEDERDRADDPQGARYVLRDLIDPDGPARYLTEYHEREDLAAPAAALCAAAEARRPLTADLLAPFALKRQADELLARAAALDLQPRGS